MVRPLNASGLDYSATPFKGATLTFTVSQASLYEVGMARYGWPSIIDDLESQLFYFNEAPTPGAHTLLNWYTA
jgi:hypothetical protein